MSKETSLQIKSTTAEGKKVTKTYNYINPNVGDTDLASFSGKISDMSENTYRDTVRVEKEDIVLAKVDDGTGGGSKLNPQLTLDKYSVSGSRMASYTVTATYEGDGTLTAEYTEPLNVTIDGKTITIMTTDNVTQNITIQLSSTDDYESATATINANLSGIGGN